MSATTQSARLIELRQQIAAHQPVRWREEGSFSTGCQALDRELPGGGLQRGTIVEWLIESEGVGGATLALLAAREASREGGAIVVCDRWRRFYPPAAWGLGFAARQLVVLQPNGLSDEQWAIEQCLRCTSVAATWSYAAQVDATTFRRWQLAAEIGGGLGLLVRPAYLRGTPSWSDLQLLVQPPDSRSDRGRRLCLEVIRCRGGPVGMRVELEIDETASLHATMAHETHPRTTPAQLAHRSPGSRAARA